MTTPWVRCASVLSLVLLFGCSSGSDGGSDGTGGSGGNGAAGSQGSAGSRTCADPLDQLTSKFNAFPGPPPGTCAPLTACVQEKCTGSPALSYDACFGANYASRDFTGGQCADYLDCQTECHCDSACLQDCARPEHGTLVQCQGCLGLLGLCVQSTCATELGECPK